MALTTLEDVVTSLSPRGSQDAIVAFGREDLIHISFAELASRIDHMAAGLRGAGVDKGDRVGMLAPNQPNWIIAALAAIRAGATLVPMDVQLPDQTLAHILSDAKPKVLCTLAAQTGRIRASRAAPHTIVLLDEQPQSSGRRVHPQGS